ncbi:SDR family oxidoreductase [Robertkochia aurantiaca]|uniref:SDR family oxidoreductase n=1 Tax=Robertkochia aurantiaca TaxID=2873700 RepID=UPI001CCDC721|nr:SDR family oxidoreductase [Robertkochia sp. 3YJGBD-33]
MSKVVLITGGSSGIGRAVCTYLTDKGYTVYGTSRNPEKLPSEKFHYTLERLDVTDPGQVQDLVGRIKEKEGRIDVLINNAGVGITGPVEETPREEIEKAFDTNFYGPLNLINAVLPVMREQKSGLIINITSIAGYMGLPYRGIYSATKGALSLVSESLQMEVHEFNIDICNIAPGDFNTDIANRRYHAPMPASSPYSQNYEQVLDIVNKQVAEAGEPLKIAKTVEKIIRSKNRKIHYKVGAFMEKFSVVLKKILPDKVFKKLLLNHYKL